MNKNLHARKFSGLVLLPAAVALVGGCANNPIVVDTVLPCDAVPADKVVAILFDDDNCPITAKPNYFEIEGRDKFLCWVSADKDENRKVYNFELFFDPFVGSPNGSGGNGLFRKKIDNDAPITTNGVDYKYTVSGKDCNEGDDRKYLDPRFRVRK